MTCDLWLVTSHVWWQQCHFNLIIYEWPINPNCAHINMHPHLVLVLILALIFVGLLWWIHSVWREPSLNTVCCLGRRFYLIIKGLVNLLWWGRGVSQGDHSHMWSPWCDNLHLIPQPPGGDRARVIFVLLLVCFFFKRSQTHMTRPSTYLSSSSLEVNADPSVCVCLWHFAGSSEWEVILGFNS